MTGVETSMQQVRERHVGTMRLTCRILDNILAEVTEAQAHDLRDGPDGWSIVEIVCHLRDFDGIFHSRAQMMLQEDYPRLPAFDHEAMAVERSYQQEDLAVALQQLKESRAAFIAFFESLDVTGWDRAGVHPERDSFTMTDAIIQVGLHDLDHLEQITRVLAQ